MEDIDVIEMADSGNAMAENIYTNLSNHSVFPADIGCEHLVVKGSAEDLKILGCREYIPGWKDTDRFDGTKCIRHPST